MSNSRSHRGGDLEAGALYQIVYKTQSGNGRWQLREMTAVYLGHDTDEFDAKSIWSLRPLFGSTALSDRHSPLQSVKMLIDAKGISKLGGVRAANIPVRASRSLGYCDPPPGFGD